LEHRKRGDYMCIDLFSFEGLGTFINSQGFSFKAPITYFWDTSRIERTQISSIETHVEDLNISKILPLGVNWN